MDETKNAESVKTVAGKPISQEAPKPVAAESSAKPQVQQTPPSNKRKMKSATIVVKLSRDADVVRHNVTPIEAILLTAEHHRYVGGSPIEHASITNEVMVERSIDEELDRLKTIYRADKVQAVMNQVRDMPEDYESAVQRGIKMVLPSSHLSQTKL